MATGSLTPLIAAAGKMVKASVPGNVDAKAREHSSQQFQIATQLDLLDGRRKKRNPRVRTPEHLEQVALMQWASLPAVLKRHPELHLLHAVPNGGHRFPAVARAMKEEGVKAGVPDLDLPVPRGEYCGLRIELKTKGGRLQPAQSWWLKHLAAHGHQALVCVGWEAAREAILAYLAMPRAGWFSSADPEEIKT